MQAHISLLALMEFADEVPHLNIELKGSRSLSGCSRSGPTCVAIMRGSLALLGEVGFSCSCGLHLRCWGCAKRCRVVRPDGATGRLRLREAELDVGACLTAARPARAFF